MEISSLLTQDAHEAGAELNVLKADGDATDVFITLLGVDSRQWRRAFSAVSKEWAGKKDISEDDHLLAEAKTLAAVTTGWRGLVENGKEYKFSQEACTKLYLKSPGVARQVEAFIRDHRNFTKG